MNPLLVIGFVAGSAVAPRPPSGPGSVIDQGTFKVYQRDRAVGTETFQFLSGGDSLTVYSHVTQVLPGPEGDLPIDKVALLTVGAPGYDLKAYASTLKTGGRDLTRGLVVNDTAFTAYRQSTGHGGSGDRFSRPPGRVFVLDGQVFVLFDVMCRDLATQTFKQRPVSVIVLRDELDQVTEIRATDLGSETIRWAARPVVARKLQFADSYSTFNAWVGPRGTMLRLEQDGSGLRVEREPSPPVKRAEQPTPR